jgi:hypothetical protein
MELINNEGKVILVKKFTVKSDYLSKKGWDFAHDYIDELIEQDKKLDFVEPNISSSYLQRPIEVLKKSSNEGYLESWPKPVEQSDKFIWHLNDDFSQLRKAKNKVLIKLENPKIKIAIIDTGYQDGHPFLPKNIIDGISFIKGEEGQPPYDIDSGTDFEQNGHGTATINILAGCEVTKNITDGVFEGYFGAIPFAEIVPIRICETVALIRTDSFVDAVEYAINQGCEVISMSMAGAPTKAWARVVNKAYENGVVLVTAAGNSWYKGVRKLLPKRLLYPARWERVIAATGVAADHLPYVMDARLKLKSEEGETMQGNYGPSLAMKTALAAYTPNISWATLNSNGKYFRLDGGGTSSSTPQIAAAAALWITYYRNEIEEIVAKNPNDKWQKVEMVKNALFNSADKTYSESEIYFGQGILKADRALTFQPILDNVSKAKEATVSLWGILDLLGLLLRLKIDNEQENKVRSEMFEVEILQEIYENPNLYKLLDYNDNDIWTKEEKDLVKTELLKSDRISNRLKGYIKV